MTRRIEMVRIFDGAAQVSDDLAVEEPLEIQLETAAGERRSLSITMRTPGDDEALAAGFLFSEGILDSPAQIESITPCGKPVPPSNSRNVVLVKVREGVEVDFARLQRNFYTTSSCGVCGKSSIEALRVQGVAPSDEPDFVVDSDVLFGIAGTLLESQTAFHATGGLHASAIFNLHGKLIELAEDVGRHNALDKVIGRCFLSGRTPLLQTILLVSGRASFELVQKAAVARIAVIVAVGAPSSLAVELAAEMNMTLVGFLRDARFNLYTGVQRIKLLSEPVSGAQSTRS